MKVWPDWGAMARLEADALGGLKPERVLHEFEGPCIFTSRTPQGGLLLAYLVEELDDQGLRYLVVMTSEATVELLTRGTISVREGLVRGSMWVVEVDPQGPPRRVAACASTELPSEVLPNEETMLSASLES